MQITYAKISRGWNFVLWWIILSSCVTLTKKRMNLRNTKIRSFTFWIKQKNGCVNCTISKVRKKALCGKTTVNEKFLEISIWIHNSKLWNSTSFLVFSNSLEVVVLIFFSSSFLISFKAKPHNFFSFLCLISSIIIDYCQFADLGDGNYFTTLLMATMYRFDFWGNITFNSNFFFLSFVYRTKSN